MKIDQWLHLAQHQLALAHSVGTIDLGEPVDRQAQREAELLLCEALKQPRSYLRSHDKDTLSSLSASCFVRFVQLRSQGHPVAYILGQQAFYDHDFVVTANTLIPRADTETIIETIQTLDLPPTARILDLGCGSGIIGLTLKALHHSWSVYLSDISQATLAVAQHNANRLGLQSVAIRQSDWFACIPQDQPFDLIVSNPPYVESAHPLLQKGDVRYEPRSALTSGVNGMDAIEQIIQDAGHYLTQGGWLCLEHGYMQGPAVRAALSKYQYANISTHNDLGNRARVSLGQLG